MSNNSWWHMLPDIWKRHHGICHYCSLFTIPMRWLADFEGATVSDNHKHILWLGQKWAISSIEHLVERSKGGKNTHKNCVLSCIRCNVDRNKQNQKILRLSAKRQQSNSSPLTSTKEQSAPKDVSVN